MNKLEELQEQLAFQELTVEKLNNALVSQQQQITELNKKLDLAIKLIKSMQNENQSKLEENAITYEIPPHY